MGGKVKFTNSKQEAASLILCDLACLWCSQLRVHELAISSQLGLHPWRLAFPSASSRPLELIQYKHKLANYVWRWCMTHIVHIHAEVQPLGFVCLLLRSKFHSRLGSTQVLSAVRNQFLRDARTHSQGQKKCICGSPLPRVTTAVLDRQTQKPFVGPSWVLAAHLVAAPD